MPRHGSGLQYSIYPVGVESAGVAVHDKRHALFAKQVEERVEPAVVHAVAQAGVELDADEALGFQGRLDDGDHVGPGRIGGDKRQNPARIAPDLPGGGLELLVRVKFHRVRMRGQDVHHQGDDGEIGGRVVAAPGDLVEKNQ